MGSTSILFFVIFFIPLIGLLFWVMRQDKRKGKIGLLVLTVLVLIGIWLIYMMMRGK